MAKLQFVKVDCFFLYMVLGVVAFGQTAKKSDQVTGMVIGSISCADTNAPARFALVTLNGFPRAGTQKSVDIEQKTVTTTSDLEGHFVVDKVPPGQYLVVGSLTGYLNPLARFTPEQMKTMTEETRKALTASIPVVDVEADQTATATVRLERASEVSGTVLYDDGSPAVGLKMLLLGKDKDGSFVAVNPDLKGDASSFGLTTQTDDRGRYRMVGTPQGEYLVQATLPTGITSASILRGGAWNRPDSRPNLSMDLKVYSGDVFRKKEGKVIKVGEGEQVDGEDIQIALAGLHIVRGTVTARRDGHALNFGSVSLLDPDDRTPERSAGLEPDGSFVFTCVPEGSYILHAFGNDVRFKNRYGYLELDEYLRRYAPADSALTVKGDLSGVNLAVPDDGSDKASPN